MKKFTSKTQRIGKVGEDLACRYLARKGFKILERNYTKKWGEIDIIARKENVFYFIEVKTRRVGVSFFENNEKFFASTEVRPEDNVHLWKIKRLRRVIETYLISQRVGNIKWQFDLLLVFLNLEKHQARIKMVKNIIL